MSTILIVDDELPAREGLTAALDRGDTETMVEQAHIALDLAHRTGNRWTEERVRDYLGRWGGQK